VIGQMTNTGLNSTLQRYL